MPSALILTWRAWLRAWFMVVGGGSELGRVGILQLGVEGHDRLVASHFLAAVSAQRYLIVISVHRRPWPGGWQLHWR